jgi:hypothetical protein
MRDDLPRLEEVGPDDPLRLNVAAALAYPDGSMTASGLRREAARGSATTFGFLQNYSCRLETKEAASAMNC